MTLFFSRRNQVYPVTWNGRCAVEKHFTQIEDWQREYDFYRVLRMPHPELLEARPGMLTLARCPQPTLLEELERQERAGFCPEPWDALAAWISGCSRSLGQLPAEGNLRNFLWDAEQGTVLGIDFEGYMPGCPSWCGALLIAALLEYTPKDTQVKQAAAVRLAKRLEVSELEIRIARANLQKERAEKQKRQFSGMILAGGKSSRMGREKANLLLHGKTLLEWQADKLRALGITDILLSGANCPALPGTKIIPDILQERGPLGGLHACLQTAEHPQCIVLTVDTPLLPAWVLSKMCCAHEMGVTVLGHHGKQEPLIGVYDKSVGEVIAPLIAERSAPVRALRDLVEWSVYEYYGPEELLLNCNTPEEFQQAESCDLTWPGLRDDDGLFSESPRKPDCRKGSA